MALRYCILTLCLLLQLAPANAQPKNIVVKKLDNYFLSQQGDEPGGTQCMVITKEKDFDKTFGIAKTMNNTIIRPDFATEAVVLVALPPTNKNAKVEILSALVVGNIIEVFFKTSKERFPLPYTTRPLAVATVPRYKNVTKVKFYEGKTLVDEVSVK